ncbi:UDP-N-acetylglucosamine 2-epimerase [Teredinibacter purpureus]|uniref:UDP-N-acetylglucosamine 2-epimerase n=1 Tax=Teredinibacter purpureus TaxID=2731756 RepID=UPI0005F7E82B|nr:UDP-N-acetylglucosamine 2-epimerase [Teredinibacter purpureus]
MIHVFIGTKAQLIKMAPIMKELQNRKIPYNFIFSGQHKDTMDLILKNFGIDKEPDATLYNGRDITGIMQMANWAIQIIIANWNRKNLNKLFKHDTKGIILNHGDTFSTLLGTFLGKRQGLKTAHIESGLRSHNLFHPFPEEILRLLSFKLTDYFFAPGEAPLKNLNKVKGVKINTGENTLYDAISATPRATTQQGQPYGIISIHRFENIFSRKMLSKIVNTLTSQNDSIQKRFILHKPTENKLREYNLLKKLEECPSIELCPRYDYFKFTSLLKNCEYLITDGGSNQEECYYLGLPCLLMRKATEREEGLGENAVLSGYNNKLITAFIQHYKTFKRPPIAGAESPSKIIVDSISLFSH